MFDPDNQTVLVAEATATAVVILPEPTVENEES